MNVSPSETLASGVQMAAVLSRPVGVIVSVLWIRSDQEQQRADDQSSAFHLFTSTFKIKDLAVKESVVFFADGAA